MQTDSFFTKGVSHKVCEDYTMHGEIAGNPFIIVCDGCSGSDDTDFGARLLARSAKRTLEGIHNSRAFDYADTEDEKYSLLENDIRSNLGSMLKATESAISVGDATLLIAFQYDDNIYVYMRGDGTFAYKDSETNELTICTVEFLSGAPYYLTYDLSIMNAKAYKQQFNMDKTFNQIIISDTGEEIEHFPSSTTMLYHDHVFFKLHIDKKEFISIMSDGVSAFQYSSKYMGERVSGAASTANIVKEINSFKNYQGEFVQRRMNMAMRKFEKQGLENFDDVSIATIWLKD